jgi:hypothetical protein
MLWWRSQNVPTSVTGRRPAISEASAFDPLRLQALLLGFDAGTTHMRLRFIRPLHGWREFIHEVVAVVIGVLLALAGAEIIESWRWQ